MEFSVSNRLKRIVVGLTLAVYVSALIVLPVAHTPWHHRGETETSGTCCRAGCPDDDTPEPISNSSCGDDCEFCRFLHLTVPFFVCADVPLETSDIRSEPLPLDTAFDGADVFGLPSSRAPPIA